MLRVFITLFNLQGARRARGGSFFILPHLRTFVKLFFELFLNSFDAVRVSGETASIVYHILPFLSSSFFKFFRNLFRLAFPAPGAIPSPTRLSAVFQPPSPERLITIPDSSPAVNTFFRFFKIIFCARLLQIYPACDIIIITFF